MTVYQYLDLSTAHLPMADREALENDECYLRTINHEYGWWVHVPTDDLESMLEECTNMTEEFKNVIRFAHTKGCNWINFDGDADEEEDDLPTFTCEEP